MQQKAINIYKEFFDAKRNGQKLLAILLDPDKIDWKNLNLLIFKINQSSATYIFIGGSIVKSNRLDELILSIKEKCKLPIVLFPGNPSQISDKADAILFLSLISGRDPNYLIEHQINAVPILEKTSLEIISTGYILIESGSETAVERVSNTRPMPNSNVYYISQTAKAGEMIGNKLIYLEAGSGAKNAVSLEVIRSVSKRISVPLIVGGGIRSKTQIEEAFNAGADLIVIGTAFENDINFFD